MIPITANVSNALVRYGQCFGRKPQISDISTKYQDPEEFVRDIDDAITHKEPIFGGEYGAGQKSKKVTVKIPKKIKKEMAEMQASQLTLLPDGDSKEVKDNVTEAPVKRKRGRPRKQA